MYEQRTPPGMSRSRGGPTFAKTCNGVPENTKASARLLAEEEPGVVWLVNPSPQKPREVVVMRVILNPDAEELFFDVFNVGIAAASSALGAA